LRKTLNESAMTASSAMRGGRIVSGFVGDVGLRRITHHRAAATTTELPRRSIAVAPIRARDASPRVSQRDAHRKRGS
jgi:hypothetical protein